MTLDPTALWEFLHSRKKMIGPWEDFGIAWRRQTDPRDPSIDLPLVRRLYVVDGYFCPKSCATSGGGQFCPRCGERLMHDLDAKAWAVLPARGPRIFADTADEAKALVDARLVADGYLLVPQPPDAE